MVLLGSQPVRERMPVDELKRPGTGTSECVRGRFPLPKPLHDELGALLRAPALEHLEI
jgi:hypothetical protein